MTTLDIGSIVSVRATIAPSGTPREEFGRTLLLTADNALPVSARLRNFANLVEVAEVFPPDSEPYRAARVYFSQSPYPRNLLIGRWAESGSLSRLRGGTPLPLEQITGVPTVVRGAGVVASLDSFHGRATVLTGGSPASLTGTVADLVNFHGLRSDRHGDGGVPDDASGHHQRQRHLPEPDCDRARFLLGHRPRRCGFHASDRRSGLPAPRTWTTPR